ncbi:MAG: hypothetical protein AABY62_00810 [Pseudomonadota bacterium]
MAKFWMLVVPLFSAAIAFAADTTTNYPRNPVAGEKVWVNPAAEGEFTRASFGIVCHSGMSVTMPKPEEVAKATERVGRCLRIGPISVGDTRATIEASLGRPIRSIPQPQDATADFYPVRWERLPDGQQRLAVYWVIFFREGRTVAVQLTGDAYDGAVFSSVRLGDPAEKISARFGEPSSRQEVPSIGATLWKYWSYPFTFEVKNGKVYSMQVREYRGPANR